MHGRKLLVVLLLMIAGQSQAQYFPEKNYPAGYFKWPVGATIGIVANFGELRPNHYHMGLDCRTDQKQNVPVYASAEGYVAKIKIEPYGFGRAIYINHPNGLTTLYAHLNDFNPELEAYVKREQYRLKSWKVFLDIPPDAFPVTQGQLIAYSGSTGGSQGPHVHFEIRDTKTDKVLNPTLFGFPIADHTPPDLLRLAVYDRCISVYEQTPRLYTLKKVNGEYVTIPALIVANTDKVSFAISAFDRHDKSTNKNGIYEAILFENEQPVVGFQLDSIGYDETRYLNAHIDYRLRSTGGPFVQHVSRLPGYLPSPYREFSGDGVIVIEDDSVHEMRIAVKDGDGNTSNLRFGVKRGVVSPEKAAGDSMAMYRQRNFHPGFVNVFENDKLRFFLRETALYDSIRFTYRETPTANGGTIFQLHNGNTPVQGYYPIHIKGPAGNPYGDKMVMKCYWGSRADFAKAEPEANDWYKASFREFGYFVLAPDTTPPAINPVGFKDGINAAKLKRIAFVISDNSEDVFNFNAMLDGQWLRFTNDKGRTFIYNFDEQCGPGEHRLIISVEDCVGNRAERSYTFTR